MKLFRQAFLSLAFALLVSLVSERVSAFIPPDEDFFGSDEDQQRRNLRSGGNVSDAPPSWEPVHQYRQRRGLTYDYQPALINAEVCRFLNEKDCKEMDESFLRQAMSTRSTSQSSHRLKTLVILVQWPDHKKKKLISRNDMDLLWNAPLGKVDPIVYPTGSVYQYIYNQSYGNLEIDATVVDWHVTNGTQKLYANGVAGLPTSKDKDGHLEYAFHNVLDQMEAEGFNFRSYDMDGDYMLDSVLFMHSGHAADYGNNDCDSGAPYEDRIWSHARGIVRFEEQWKSKRTGVVLGAYGVSSVYRGHCNNHIARLGIMVHEYLHTMGLPDLYDLDGKFGHGFTVGGLGAYDIMSTPRGPGNRQAYPGSLSPWSKLDMGWIEPRELTQEGRYHLRPSNEFPDIVKIQKGYPEGEYLLVENRQNVGWDGRMWSNGILVYHIDETKDIRGNSARGYPGQRTWPSSGRHYPVALLQADGLYELEKAANNGNTGDFYRSSRQRLGPGNQEQVASNKGVYPNTDAYSDGKIHKTGVVLKHFRELKPAEWSFALHFQKLAAPTPAPTVDCFHIFKLVLDLDRMPDENDWELRDSKGNVLKQGDGSDYDHRFKYTFTHCLPRNEVYTFHFFDAYGDGMSGRYGEGRWTIFLDDVEIATGNGKEAGTNHVREQSVRFDTFPDQF